MEAASLRAPAALAAPRVGRLLRLRSDDQLVALFRLGNDDAFRVIHDRYRARLLAYTRQMLAGSRADAEDALQDVFLRAYGTLRADDRPVTLRAWLYRVAHNRCIDHMRRPANQPSAELHDGALTGAGSDPWADLQHRDDLRQLVADVRRLPDQQRSALLMREMEGLAYAELADALGVSLPAVKSLLVRARIGLVEAREARDTACEEIRADLVAAHDRGVKAGARSRRHLAGCTDCDAYRTALRRVRDGVAALGPPATGWSLLAKLLGLGGAGGGAAVTAGGGTGGVAAGGLVAVGGGAKVAALVCAAAAVVGGGAVEASHGLSAHGVADAATPVRAPLPAASRAPVIAPAAAARAAAAPVAHRVVVRRPPRPVATPRPGLRGVTAVHPPSPAWSSSAQRTSLAGPSADDDARLAATAGGALAPDDTADPDPLAAPGDSEAAVPSASASAEPAAPSGASVTTSTGASAPATVADAALGTVTP